MIGDRLLQLLDLAGVAVGLSLALVAVQLAVMLRPARLVQFGQELHAGVVIDARTHAALSQASQIIVVAGPTRVGKTTLGRRLTAELVSKNSEDDGRIPLVRVEAATTNQAKFSTKHFTMRMLEELQDPVTSIREGMALRHSQSETHLRLQLERCLRYRQTRYLLVDEAQHLLRSTSASRAGEVIDTLKCLANVTGIAVILMGGYELLSTCIQSPHLNGRLTIIDFPPYGDDDESIHEFDRVLLSIEDILPSRPGFLRENHEVLYRGSLGCVGLLFGWTMLALAEMEAQAHRELRLEHFTGTRYAVQNQAIADEIALRRLSLRRQTSASPFDALSTSRQAFK